MWDRMLRSFRGLLIASICVVPLFAVVTAEDQPAKFKPKDIEFFEKQVRPVLAENCYACHSAKKQEAGLRLDSRDLVLKGGDTGPSIVPGKPKESELIAAIHYDADGYQMPPEGKLKQEDINVLTRWVNEGAYWPDHGTGKSNSGEEAGFNLEERAKHWSFQPVKNQPVC